MSSLIYRRLTSTGWAAVRSPVGSPTPLTARVIVPALGVAGDTVTLGVTVTGGTAVAWSWDVPSAGVLPNRTLANPVLTLPSIPGTVTLGVTVTVSGGRTVRAVGSIDVNATQSGENPFGSHWANIAIPRIRPNWAGLTEDIIDWTKLDPYRGTPPNGVHPTKPRRTLAGTAFNESHATATQFVAGLGDVPVIEDVTFTASSVNVFHTTPGMSVILRNFEAPGNGANQSVMCRPPSGSGGGRTILVDGSVRASKTNGIVFGNWSAIRVNLRGASGGGQDGARANGACYLSGCTWWDILRDPAAISPHGDAIQLQNGNGLLIEDSWIVCGDQSTDPYNAPIALYADTGDITNVTVRDTFLNGGNNGHIDCDPKTNVISNVVAERVIGGKFIRRIVEGSTTATGFRGITSSRLCYFTDGTTLS